MFKQELFAVYQAPLYADQRFTLPSAMSEKLCLQWNDFGANVNSAFGKLRDDKEFTDVTLACEDGQQYAHTMCHITHWQ